MYGVLWRNIRLCFVTKNENKMSLCVSEVIWIRNIKRGSHVDKFAHK